MARLTKQQKVEQFYYSLNQFRKSMEEYEEYLKTSQMCANRKRVAEKNDQGLTIEARRQAVTQWEAHRIKSQEEADARMKSAIEGFEKMKKLLV